MATASDTPTTAAPSTGATTSAATAAPSGQHDEIADNQLGTPVFSSPLGGAAPNGVRGRIPYDTHVMVECYAQNESGMSSINVFYKIVGGEWNGLYAPANTFANGGPMGPNGNNIDPNVGQCS